MAIRISIINTVGPTEISGRNLPPAALSHVLAAFPGATQADSAAALLDFLVEAGRIEVRRREAAGAGDTAAVRAAADAVAAAAEAAIATMDTDWPESSL